MHIGLIGGIGPAATDVYYRELIRIAASTGRPLDLTIAHADLPTLLNNLMAGDKPAQAATYDRLTRRLKAGGADCVVVTSVAGSFCLDVFKETSVLKVIDLTEALADWLKVKGMSRVGILGTSPVMSSGVYGKLAPIEVLSPEGTGLQVVHDAYVTLAGTGRSTPALEQVFFSAGQAMMDRGAEAILLGGTDLEASFSGQDCGFPVVDCARIHIEAVAQHI